MITYAKPINFLALVALFGSVTFAQQPPSPGPEHAELKLLEGDWDFELKSPDGTSAKGTSKFKMECGGMWLMSDFRCDFGGMPFQGRGMDGYDLSKKKHVSVWVDSMISAPMLFEGSYDAKREKLTMFADAPGPDGNPAKWRSVTMMKDKDHQTFEMYVAPIGGKEQQMMTVEYVRKK